MDLWDFTMLKPGREAFKKKLEFGKLRAPHDAFAKEVGQRWFIDSGGEALKNASKTDACYQDYVNEKKEVSAVDQEQISKDLKRTKASSMSQSTVRAFLEQIPPLQMRDWLHNVLCAFCIRHRTLGYAQGMDYIVMFLLGFQSEEQAFWTFCAIVEKILPTDFYSPPPQMMNGYMAEKKLILKLACECFPQIVKAISANQLKATLDIMAPKWMICLFVDCVPLDCQCMIFESFFYREGHMGILPVVCSILQDCVDEVLQGEDILITLMERAKQVSGGKLKEGLQMRKFEFEQQRVDGVREEARKELATQWNVGGIFELHGQTNFSQEQLSQFQLGFRKLYKKNKQGLPLSLFSEVVKRSAPQLTEMISARMFHVYDRDNRHALNFAELISCMSCLCVGSPTDKTILCFQVFDTSNGGFLSTDEVEAMGTSLMGILDAMFTMKREERKDAFLNTPSAIADSRKQASTSSAGSQSKPRLIGQAANTLKGGFSKIKQTIQQGVQDLVEEHNPAYIHTPRTPDRPRRRSSAGGHANSSSSSSDSSSANSGSSSSAPSSPNPLSPTSDELVITRQDDDSDLFPKAELIGFKTYFDAQPLVQSLLALMTASADSPSASSEHAPFAAPSLRSSNSMTGLTITVPAHASVAAAEPLASEAHSTDVDTLSCISPFSDVKINDLSINPSTHTASSASTTSTETTSTALATASTTNLTTSTTTPTASTTAAEATKGTTPTSVGSSPLADTISDISLESATTSAANNSADSLPCATTTTATTSNTSNSIATAAAISDNTNNNTTTTSTSSTGALPKIDTSDAMNTSKTITTLTNTSTTTTTTTTTNVARNSVNSLSSPATSSPIPSKKTSSRASPNSPNRALTPPSTRPLRSTSRSRSKNSTDSNFDDGFEIIEAKQIGPKMTYAAFTKYVASQPVLQNFISKVFSARMVLDNTSELKEIKRADKANKWKLW